MALAGVEAGGIDEQCDYKGEEVDARDREDLAEAVAVERLVDAVAGGDQEEDTEDKGEDCEGSAVEDAKVRYMHVVWRIVTFVERFVGGEEDLGG